jgi:hypothetical protein
VGVFAPTRIRPSFVEKFQIAGIMLPHNTFDTVLEVN